MSRLAWGCGSGRGLGSLGEGSNSLNNHDYKLELDALCNPTHIHTIQVDRHQHAHVTPQNTENHPHSDVKPLSSTTLIAAHITVSQPLLFYRLHHIVPWEYRLL